MSMQPTRHRNASAATAAGLSQLLSRGQALHVRGKEIREIRNNIIVLERPVEKVLIMPHRGNSVFAALAETMWVLAGRNDLGWLKTYLRRAPDFSDDGQTWRAGYGPRLRNWKGVDQIEEVLKLLRDESTSRRAVMSLYDPAVDFVESKDIPCNNWLHWLIRDGRLHLNIGVRSNDIVWGFSGINAFEWSVLHELMAFWVGVDVGEATYFASSFHIYKDHYERAERISAAFRPIYCYDHGIGSPKFSTPWRDFGKTISTWFELEAEIRKNPDTTSQAENYIKDQFLKTSLEMMRLYNGAAAGWDGGRIGEQLAKMPATDLTVAAYEFFGRKHPDILKAIPHPSISEFFARYQEPATSSDAATIVELLAAVKSLHKRKDAAYGTAWKKRGEFTSVLANIARKVDRLAQFNLNGTELADESAIDTAVDLFVYAAKYVLFLLEHSDVCWQEILPNGSPTPFSDHVVNFDWLLDHMPEQVLDKTPIKETINKIIPAFEEMHDLAGKSSPVERLRTAIKFKDISFALIEALYRLDPQKLATIR